MKIRGFIENYKFRNQENGYAVFDFSCEDESISDVVCKGILAGTDVGDYLELEGEFEIHPSYGPQFKATSYIMLTQPSSVNMLRYLASGAVKGIGPSLASRIVDKFGDETMRIMEEEPERLSEIKGISDRKAREIAIQFTEKKDIREAVLYLQQFGISNALAVRIYNTYGIGMYGILKQNPYRLAQDLKGVGFRIADDIASKMGIRVDSDVRIRCGIVHTLRNASMEGHMYLPEPMLKKRASDLLDVSEDVIQEQLGNLMIDRKLICKEYDGEKQFYSAEDYYEELRCAVAIKEELDSFNNLKQDDAYEIQILDKIHRLEEKLHLTLNEMQRQAILLSIEKGICIITGGPGTGKTTIIRVLINYFTDKGMDVVLAAPTGRAAKRMTQATGYEASTIHRLLELNGTVSQEEEIAKFAKNEDNPIEADVIIVDEMSMVDIHLFHALLRAIIPGTRLIMTGDCDQLPSVGPGNVLKDLMKSKRIETVKLMQIYRQANESDIIMNAHRIKNGEDISFTNQSKDFFFLERDDFHKIYHDIVILVRDKMPRYVNASQVDIQVLTPMRKGPLGVEKLNQILQSQLNPADRRKKEYDRKDGVFRVGDKVMQTKNNYNAEWEICTARGMVVDTGKGVFNGDVGIIRDIEEKNKEIIVVFDDGKTIHYPFAETEDLELAYAMTIHKSQGSEYPAVIIPIFEGPDMLMNRNLLYTAVTRGASCVILLGSRNRALRMIANVGEHVRYSGLTERLLEII